MPLNTAAPSATRRAILLFVLVLLFCVSLALAEAIVAHRTGGSWIEPPPGFESIDQIAAEMKIPPKEAWQGRVNGGTRVLYVFVLPMKAKVSPAELKGISLVLYNQSMDSIGAQLTQEGVHLSASTLGGVQALELSGFAPHQQAFELQRSALIDGNVAAIFYAGNTPATDTDWKYYNDIACGSFTGKAR